MKVNATRLIRKMRGGSQAHLLECDDGHSYVVKFMNNPQHQRILVNEWLASSILARLEISTPEIAIVNMAKELLAEEPDIYIDQRCRKTVVPGQHFGSRYPGSPGKAMVYDFVPDKLLGRVANRTDFIGTLVVDKWTGNADARQAIFSRLRPPGKCGNTFRQGLWYVSMIDQGGAFGGPSWRFLDSPLQGMYFRPSVYQSIRSLDDFQPWLDRAMCFPVEEFESMRVEIPPEWIAGDQRALEELIDRLLARRTQLPQLIANAVRAPQNPFPLWSGTSVSQVRPRDLGLAPLDQSRPD
ncbi:MAG TPA: HipA family kinase [Bryobacteraceae bacterium]|nr:HipA family kinase [Bryobacteraceae bacterium]